MIQSAKEFYKLRTSSVQAEYAKATQEEAPLEVWLEIVKAYPEMRFWVAQNKTVPVEILEILAVDADKNVRLMVASKRKLPEKLQLQLTKDKDIAVRKQLIYNRKVSLKILRVLLEDSSALIRQEAEKKINELSRETQ